MIQQQQMLILNPYIDLYNSSFAPIRLALDVTGVWHKTSKLDRNEELKERYCLDNGRNAIE